jgi:hypothetical protein
MRLRRIIASVLLAVSLLLAAVPTSASSHRHHRRSHYYRNVEVEGPPTGPREQCAGGSYGPSVTTEPILSARTTGVIVHITVVCADG